MIADLRAQFCRVGRVAICAALLGSVAGCHPDALRMRADGLDPAVLPPNIQASYQLFADRCSKCHSLARALNATIDSDEYWDVYVERMRRQPGSGISVNDTHIILQFLYFYTASHGHQRILGFDPRWLAHDARRTAALETQPAADPDPTGASPR